jgi:tetratricopeptide (TPR) repeat protein
MKMKAQQILGAIFFVLTLVFLVIAYFNPSLRGDSRIPGVFAALCAGFSAFFFTGDIMIQLEGTIPSWGKISLQAAGGIAVFVFVLLWWNNVDQKEKQAPSKDSSSISIQGSQYAKEQGQIFNITGGQCNITIQQGLNAEAIVEKLIKQLSEKDQRIGQLTQDNVQLKQQAVNAIARVDEQVNTGNVQAEKAIQDATQHGDVTGLLAILSKKRVPLQKAATEDRSALIEINREIAALAYLTGHIDTATSALQEILSWQPDDVFAINQMGNIYQLQGRLKEAEASFKKVLALSNKDFMGQATAYNNLGIVYQTRGDLKEAEAMQQKALEINKELKSREGMTANYGNLGIVYHIRGDLKKAEVMHQKALEIDTDMENRQGMAVDYGNLGGVYQTRGDLKGAEALYRKALKIDIELENRQGMANQYGNLGDMYRVSGDLKEAEAMCREALEINKELGRREGMANQYCNLGNVYGERGDLKKAEPMYRKALDLYEAMGNRQGMANLYGNLGIVYRARGDLKEAEAMFRKALEINKELGRREGMANQYSNLGLLYKQQNKLARAVECWNQAQSLYEALENPKMVATIQRWLVASAIQSWLDKFDK